MMVLRNYQLKHESFGFWSFWRFWRLGDSDRYQPVRLIFSTPSLTELLVSFHRETNPFHPPLGTISSWILPVEYIKPNIAVEQRLHGLVNVFASRDYSDMRQLPVIVVIVVGGGVVAVTPDTPLPPAVLDRTFTTSYLPKEPTNYYEAYQRVLRPSVQPSLHMSCYHRCTRTVHPRKPFPRRARSSIRSSERCGLVFGRPDVFHSEPVAGFNAVL
ncbi:hypothetical protein PG990_011238 [Apiospora arundinis]